MTSTQSPSQQWFDAVISIDILMHVGFRSQCGFEKRLGWHIECRHFYDVLTCQSKPFLALKMMPISSWRLGGFTDLKKDWKNARLKPSQTTNQSNETRFSRFRPRHHFNFSSRPAPSHASRWRVLYTMSVCFLSEIERPKFRGSRIFSHRNHGTSEVPKSSILRSTFRERQLVRHTVFFGF